MLAFAQAKHPRFAEREETLAAAMRHQECIGQFSRPFGRQEPSAVPSGLARTIL